MNSYNNDYILKVQRRSNYNYLKGLLIRFFIDIKFGICRFIARKNGAIIGENTILPLRLARIANKNLIVGNNVIIQSHKLDLRSPISIGNNVIIGESVEILTNSHDIHSINFELISLGISIDDFAWLATKCFILPSCRSIGYGAVIGAGSVVSKNIEDLSIYVGNPAQKTGSRAFVHKSLIVPSLVGGDLNFYIRARKNTPK